MNENFGFSVKGHVLIKDDLGNTLLDKDNAVHPQNMARVIARALSNENNYFIHRIAFGTGGTQTDAAYAITYKTPNDGQSPDVRTWDSRLYKETYSEIIDDSSPDIGTDPGSAGPNVNTRPGGGADPSGDPASIQHVSGPGVRSNELGLTSEVVISAVLNPGEPTGQFGTDNQAPEEFTESSFTFDEIGLFTTGAPARDSSGSFDVDVGNRTSVDDTGLTAGTLYSFSIEVDGTGTQEISFTTPLTGGSGPGGEILYGDLCEAINTGNREWNDDWSDNPQLPAGSTVAITDNTENFDSITGSQTFGFLRFVSASVGDGSSVVITRSPVNDLFASLNPPTGGTLPASGNPGLAAGIQNFATSPAQERERLLSHIIFSPVLKSANRTLTITYTLTVSVARTQS